MAMLTHDFERLFHPSEGRPRVRPTAAKAQLAAIKRFSLCALTIFLAGGALAAVIALKTGVYFWRFRFGVG